MKDNLKDFINEHRAEFDHLEPSDKVWAGIKNSTSKSGKSGVWSSVILWRAAAVLFFGLSVYQFIASGPSERREASQLQVELRDMESFYGDQMAEKFALINNLENGYEDDQFSQDVQKLDAMYEVLREEMKVSPSVKVKDALILNMLIRIDLLNQQIKKIEDHNKMETNAEI